MQHTSPLKREAEEGITYTKITQVIKVFILLSVCF